MSGLRLIIGMPLAIAVTVGLFLLMSEVIADDGVALREPPAPIGSFRANIPEPDRPTPPKPDARPTELPAPPPVPINPTYEGGGLPTQPHTPPAPPAPPGEGILQFPKQLRPIVRFDPPYPQQCITRNVEGFVIVEFDITPNGAVTNPRIISSSHNCFNHRSVLNALTKWKYNPTGQYHRGQRTTLTFKLQG